jgi:PAS domain S-box-containing protein
MLRDEEGCGMSSGLLTTSSFNVLVFPADDTVLSERVREKIAGPKRRPTDDALQDLRKELRLVYPRLDVRLQNALAGFGEPTVYIFRDGGASGELGPGEWVADAGCASVVTDDAGTYIEVNAAAGELFGCPPQSIVGQRAGAFTTTDARIEDGETLWRLLERTGRLHSLAVVSRPNGEQVRVEFVTVRDGGGEGRHVTYLRPFAG